MDASNILSGKRERTPKKVLYVPEDNRLKKHDGRGRKSLNESDRQPRNRNQAVSGEDGNKWENYRNIVKKALMYLVREQHYLEAYVCEKALKAANKKQQDLDKLKIEKKIHTAKQIIVSTLNSISNENEHDKKWPQLAEADEDDMVEVEDIFCSKCNLEETEDNDILLCDRAGCLRAYHQNCLDPPITMLNFDASQDWFCWQCECLDDCLDLISEKLNYEQVIQDWRIEVFPEINNPDQALLMNTIDTINGVILPEEEGEEEEEEYQPDEDNNHYPDDDEEPAEEEQDQEQEEEEQQEEEEKAELYFNEEVEEEDEIIDDEECEEDDEDDDGEVFSELESDLDEEELAGLLEDADMHYQVTLVSEAPPPMKTRLRDRSKLKPLQVVLLEGEKDIGKEVARVQRGVFVIGSITGFAYQHPTIPAVNADANTNANAESKEEGEEKKIAQQEENNDDEQQIKQEEEEEEYFPPEIIYPPSETIPTTESTSSSSSISKGSLEDAIWTVTYSDGNTCTYTVSLIRDALSMYSDYLNRIERQDAGLEGTGLQQQIKELVTERGTLSTTNILANKRSHKSIDYCSLSLELFGSLHDEDDDVLEGQERHLLLTTSTSTSPTTSTSITTTTTKSTKKKVRDEEYTMSSDENGNGGKKRRSSSRKKRKHYVNNDHDEEENEEDEISDFEDELTGSKNKKNKKHNAKKKVKIVASAEKKKKTKKTTTKESDEDDDDEEEDEEENDNNDHDNDDGGVKKSRGRPKKLLSSSPPVSVGPVITLLPSDTTVESSSFLVPTTQTEEDDGNKMNVNTLAVINADEIVMQE